jgi:acetate kinase
MFDALPGKLSPSAVEILVIPTNEEPAIVLKKEKLLPH